MPFFSRTLSCFYCGTSTGKKWDRSIRKFHCAHCEAENYLDEHGDITEPQFDSGSSTPPIATASSQNTYAQSFSSAPPELSLDSSAIFCRTCTHNQRFQAETLANYLPPTSDPRYYEYERNLPVFRANLEERYPQVCADCVDKANKRLKTATYAASADNLRRGTLKTRQDGIVDRPERRGAKALIWLGVWAWRLSLLCQMVWNVVGLLPAADETVPTLEQAEVMMLMPTPTISNCLQHSRKTLTRRHDCDAALAQIGLLSLMLSFGSAWAHTSLSKWIKSRNSRLIGYGDFAVLQVTVLAARTLSWWLLMNPSDSKLARRLDFPLEALHGFMLVFNIATNLVAASLVQIQRKILYPFDQPIPEITAPPAAAKQSQHRPISANNEPSRSGFPLNRLDPLNSLRSGPLYLNDENFDDTASIATDATTSVATYSTWTENKMEWEPTNTATLTTSFHPNPPSRFLQSQSVAHVGPSPFRGTLPPAPEPPAHRMRKPKAPAFKAASDMSKDSFFKSMSLATDGAQQHIDTADQQREFARGTFQARTGQSDTGLEDLFGQSFGIREDGGLALAGAGSSQGDPSKAVQDSAASIVPMLVLGGFCMMGMLIIAAGLLEQESLMKWWPI